MKIFFLIFSFSFFSFGQNTNNIQISSLLEKCEKTKNEGQYKKLVSLATIGINKSSNNNYFQARFNFYKAYGYEYDNNQYEKAIPLFEKSLNYSQKGKNLKEHTLALMRLNYLYFSTKKFKQREELISYIKKILDTTKNVYTQGILNGSLGEYYLDNSEFEKFIQYKLKAINYRKKIPKNDSKNIINIGISYSQIGQAYFKMKQYNKGIEYQNYAKPYLKKSNNALAFLYNDYIKCFYKLSNSDSLFKYYQAINPLITTNDSLYISRSSANRYLAEYFIEKNQLKEAKKYISKASVFAQKSNDEAILMELHLTKGKYLYYEKEYLDAIVELEKSLKYSYEFDKESYISTNQFLSKCYEELGNWEKAYFYKNEFAKSNETMLLESVKQSIANAEARYQNQQKQERINALSIENKLKNLQIKNATKQKIYFSLGVILLGIIASLLFYQNQNRKKVNTKLLILNSELDQANKVKTCFFSILNHDLRSPVANLIHFLHLQKENPELLDEATKKRFEEKTMEGVENLLTSMEDLLLWSKGQMENFKPQPEKIAIEKLFNDTKKVFSGYQNIKFEYHNPENIEIFTDENYLKTIVRNLTSNAINVFTSTTNPTIIWKAWQENDQSYLSITDNGTGASLEQFKALYDDKEVVGIKTGLGLHLIRDLAKAINCEIIVDSKINEGTTFTLKL